MQHVLPFSKIRLALIASATIALAACSTSGQQQVTPTGGSGLSPVSGPRNTTSATVTTSSDADGSNVVYDSIPTTLKAVSSVGFEAAQGLELGDGVNLTAPGKLTRVRYVLASWACQSGNWSTGDCVTYSNNARFPVAFTLNVYAVDNSKASKVGNLLYSQLHVFDIPYRPSSNSPKCPDHKTFFSKPDNACVHGLANVITFSMEPDVSIPSQVIVSLSYNTTHYGPNPIGESATCYHASGGCGYDSLNISTDGPGGPIGSPIDPNGIFASFTTTGEYCDASGLGFRLDTPCWTGYHPQFEVQIAKPKGSPPPTT